MNRKNTNIAVLLIVAVISIFVILGFFGIGGFNSPEPENTSLEAVLGQIRDAGGVTELLVQDITVGTGDPVAAGDTILVHYVGLLPDGTVFDSSRERGEPFPLVLGEGRVIQGWEQGLVGMQNGGRRLLVIPPSLGYGASGFGPIPPNATLIFEVELLEVIPAGE